MLFEGYDVVDDAIGDGVLAHQRHGLVMPGAVDHGHRVGVDVEAGLTAGDVVGDDQVEMLLATACVRRWR